MRRAWFAATACFVLVSGGCGKNPLELRFNVDKSIPEQTIEGSFAPCQLPIAIGVLSDPFQVTITQEEDFPEQDTDVQHVTSARLKQLTLSLTPTSLETTWDFLETLEIFVEASGLERKLVASIGEGTASGEPIPEGASTLDLEPERLNLAKYIKANGGFTMTSEATGCAPAQDAVFDGELRVRIVADPL